MNVRKSFRAKRVSRVVLALTVLAPCPLLVHAQDAEQGVQEAPLLTPPSLLPDIDLALPELPTGSASAIVVVELTVGTDGSASDAVVLASAGEELDRAALAAIPRLRFQPALRGATPIAARIPFRFEFQPRAEPAPAAPPEQPVQSALAEYPQVAAITLDVQGERPPRETTVHTVDVKEVQKLPGSNGDPVRAIENMPGVARPPFAVGQLVVRGSAPEDSAVFIDGLEVPFAYHLGGLASVVPSDALARLDFRPGNFGAEYGRAMGGIVDMSLRAPRTDRVGGMLQVDSIDGRVLMEGPLRSRTRFLVGARRSWLDAWVGKLDDDIAAAPVYYDAQAILEHDFNQRTTAQLYFLAADSRMKLLFDEPVDNDPGSGDEFSIGMRFTRLGVRTRSQLTEDVSLRQTIAWGTNQFDASVGSFQQDVGAHTVDARSELRARYSDWLTAAVGLDARFGRYDVKIRATPYPTTDEVEAPTFGRPSRLFNEEPYLFRPALYAALELTPLPGVRIVPSVRGEYVHDTKEFTVDPRLSMRADVHPTFPRTTLKGGVGLYSQPPQPQESIEPFGTRGVESNRALHASGGVEQELARGLELSLDGFYKHLWNLVVARSAEEEEKIGVRFGNSGQGRVYGAETLLRYRSQDSRLFGWLAYTLSRSERRSDASESYHLFQWDQTHILTALGNFELGRGFSAGARFRYVTGSPYTPYVGGVIDLDAGAYAPIPGETYGKRMPAFHSLDLRVDKSWLAGPTKIVAYLEVRNAYNRKNAEQIDYQYDFEATQRVTGLPILPVIGLRGEL